MEFISFSKMIIIISFLVIAVFFKFKKIYSSVLSQYIFALDLICILVMSAMKNMLLDLNGDELLF